MTQPEIQCSCCGPEMETMPIDPHTQWIDANMNLMAQYPDEWIALHPVDGIVFHAADGDTFDRWADSLPTQDWYPLMILHTTDYLTGADE